MPSTDNQLRVFQLLTRAGVPFVIIIKLDDLRFVSIRWLRKLKQAAGRHKDLDDLEHLPSS
jgi:hypothetical protein